MAKTILITGSAGSLGKRLCQALLNQDSKVIGFDRADYSGELKGYNAFKYICGDICDFEYLSSCLEGVDAAIHCAALLPDKQYLGRDAYIEVNVKGGANFLRACNLANVQKAVIISNTGVLETEHNEITYDDAPYKKHFDSIYLESKVLAEKEIDAQFLKDNVSYVILRSAAIYGPGMHYKWDTLFNLARKSCLFVFSDGSSCYSIIHIDDLIDAITLALSKLNHDISGEKITITSSEKMSIYEILKSISDYYLRRPPIKIPYLLGISAAYVISLISKIGNNEKLSAITPQNIRDYRNGLFFDHNKASNLLGFSSKREYKKEIVKILNDYR